MNQIAISGRLAFPHLAWPGRYGLGTEKYGATVYVPKDDTGTIAQVNAYIDQAIKDKWGDNPPADLARPLKDGDVKSRTDVNFAGCCYLEAYGEDKPLVLNDEAQPISTNGDEFNGHERICYLTFEAYDANGNAGVAAYLKVVRPGEARPMADDPHFAEKLLTNLDLC